MHDLSCPCCINVLRPSAHCIRMRLSPLRLILAPTTRNSGQCCRSAALLLMRSVIAKRIAAASLHAQIEEGRFAELSNSLVLPPVDDLRQAAFFLPYALLRTNADSALAAKACRMQQAACLLHTLCTRRPVGRSWYSSGRLPSFHTGGIHVVSHMRQSLKMFRNG